MSLQQTLGKNVKHWRRVCGLSQEEFAHRAQLHPTYVSGIERGRRNPTVSVMERLAEALAVSPDVLLLTEATPSRDG
jgi:transcriptional regulator with XRE-family HTH domain